ncbi:DUF3626 domain-containing protein [Longispora sp. NPDC051575]|uniref:DUF3626 domain-containing protein n=1 Tax=Longispora sp. NPDC051575 TaxID=3154943 RepID=UPI0034352A14
MPHDRLTAAQRAALDHVRAQVRGDRPLPDGPALLAAVRAHGRITLNFHPDRLLADGRTVAEGLAADGRYRSQFETGVTSGSRTAFPGGERDGWEERLFGRAYHLPPAPPTERPVYGALDLMGHPDGAAPRFGSCHVRLRPEVSARATYCHGDSHLGPTDVGTLDAFEDVLAGLVTGATAALLGVPGVDPVAHLLALGAGGPERTRPAGGPGSAATRAPGRALDDYVEAQVHGPVDLATDAEALVLDPSFAGTDTGALLVDLAARSGIAVEWHGGFTLTADAVPADFRGPAMPPLAARVLAEHSPAGLLDAEVLGRATRSAVTAPDRWAEWGPELPQYLKQLWHCLVGYGQANDRR